VPVIVLQPRAKADLSEIWEFIADDSDDQADAFIDLIDQKFQLLAQQNGLGRRRDELAEGLRSFSVGRYVIFYLPIPGGVQIVRVLHGARDIEAALTKPVADE
jgi:toxin ParE1/3/4